MAFGLFVAILWAQSGPLKKSCEILQSFWGDVPFECAFPDFRDGRYDQELSQIREIYLKQLRAK